jgi:putative DNA primase/helicase
MEPVIYKPYFYKGKTQHYEERIKRVEFAMKKAEHYLMKGDLGTAENALERFYQRRYTDDTLLKELESTIISSADLINEEILAPFEIMSPWLLDGSLNMIYGPRGAGKTWLSLMIAVAVTREKAKGTQIGPWEVSTETGVLYIDGEMGEYELQKRMKLLKKPLEKDHKDLPLDILSGNRFAKNFRKQLGISDEKYRESIYRYLEDNKQYQLLILDNIASLTPGIDENIKHAWDPINQWLISLRHLGVAVILVHHAGKSKQQRGTSGREDALDCVIQLDTNSDDGSSGANFVLNFEKARNIPSDKVEPFTLKLVECEDGGLTWISETVGANPKHEIVMALLMKDKNLLQKDIAKIMSVSAPMINKIKGEAIQKGLMDKDRNMTEKGKEFLELAGEKYDLDQYYKKLTN